MRASWPDNPRRRSQMSLMSRTLQYAGAAALLVALSSACGGGDDASGLPTLEGNDPAAVEPVVSAQRTDSPTLSQDAQTAKVADPVPTATSSDDADASATADAQSPPPTSIDAAEADPEEPEGPLDDLSREEVLFEFADCMRDNGVDFPDPVVEADGTVTFGLRLGRQAGSAAGQNLVELARDPDLPAAQEACQPIVEGIALGPGSQGIDSTEQQDRLIEFAQCMRDHGVDMGDPDLSAFAAGSESGAQGSSPFDEIDLDDPDVADAFDVCQAQVTLPGPDSNRR